MQKCNISWIASRYPDLCANSSDACVILYTKVNYLYEKADALYSKANDLIDKEASNDIICAIGALRDAAKYIKDAEGFEEAVAKVISESDCKDACNNNFLHCRNLYKRTMEEYALWIKELEETLDMLCAALNNLERVQDHRDSYFRHRELFLDCLKSISGRPCTKL